MTARCKNCRDPHFAQANVCPVKREARGNAMGWGSPSPPRRQRKQPSDAPPDAPVADGTEMEVETVEERMQEPGTEAEMEE